MTRLAELALQLQEIAQRIFRPLELENFQTRSTRRRPIPLPIVAHVQDFVGAKPLTSRARR